jgi:hypothetical protein
MKVKNWSKFQHFKDRSPPWIKLYRELLDDIQWHRLAPADAKVLVMVWLIASEAMGELPALEELAWRLRMKEADLSACLARLSHWLEGDDIAGDISVISEGYQPVPKRRGEKETETEGYSDDFEELWTIHRRGSKAKAWAEYKKAVPRKLSAEAIAEALSHYVASFSKDFSGAHLERWIKDERWEEQAGVIAPKPSYAKGEDVTAW